MSDDTQKLTAFLEDYKKLVEQHKCDFVAFPQFVPDGQGAFKVIIQQQPVDISNLPQKSPFTEAKPE